MNKQERIFSKVKMPEESAITSSTVYSIILNVTTKEATKVLVLFH